MHRGANLRNDHLASSKFTWNFPGEGPYVQCPTRNYDALRSGRWRRGPHAFRCGWALDEGACAWAAGESHVAALAHSVPLSYLYTAIQTCNPSPTGLALTIYNHQSASRRSGNLPRTNWGHPMEPYREFWSKPSADYCISLSADGNS